MITHLSEKVLFQEAKMSVETQKKLNGVIHAFEDILSTSSCDIHYAILIDMDIETDHYPPPIVSTPYTFTLKH